MELRDIALPYQQKFIDSPKRRKIWLSSRQIGKSWTCAFISVFKSLTRRNGLSLCISTGSRAASELLKKCAQFAEAIHILDPSINYSASADSIKFDNGSRVISLPSGNPASLRGWSAQCIIIDEGAFIDNPEQVWGAITPTLLRDPDAELIITTTPAGSVGWFYDIYNKALDNPTDWYVQTTTIEDAVKDGLNVDIEELKKTISDPLVWEQEFMCQFSKEFGAMLDTDLLEFADIPNDIDALPHWIGMDVGSTSDRTAIVDLAQLNDGSYFVRDIVMMNKASYESQLSIVKQKNDKLKYKGGFIDANGIGSALSEFANKQVSAKIKPFIWTSANKTPAYEDMRALVFDHKLKFASHLEQLVKQDIRNVHRLVNEAGKVSYSAGRDANGHSDATSAMVLAIQAAKQFPNQIATPQAYGRQSAFGGYDPRMWG